MGRIERQRELARQRTRKVKIKKLRLLYAAAKTDADKKVVTEAAAEATALQRKLAQEADDKMFTELKAKGVQIDKVDQGPFMKATAPVVAKWESGPIGPYVKKVVAAARAK